MTLVTTIRERGLPLIIGDLLISGRETPGHSARVPTAGLIDRVFPAGSGFTIVGLRQKIAIINDHCAVGWAGSMVGAAHIIRALRAEGQRGPLTPPRVHEIIAGAKSELREGESPSLVGFVTEIVNGGSLGVYRFHDGGVTFETNSFGKMFAAGGGVDGLRAMLRVGKLCDPKVTVV
jgi:hypothetical protein